MRSLVRRSWWAAAVVCLLAGYAVYHMLSKQKESPASIVQTPDIPAGREGAILTLADGSTVLLDSAGNGIIAKQDGTSVSLQDGRLTYDPSGNTGNDIVYNTMNTPRGRQFAITLPDGTRAWLNAASSIRYPTRFTGPERRVSITGEVYFEVNRKAAQPFRVSINDSMEVTVLGTQFNVNAYPDENSINTTLLEGSVLVAAKKEQILLRPGQQAMLNKNAKGFRVLHPNLSHVMAWKNGQFNFEGAGLQEVMRQLSRWYDIEVVYEKGIPAFEFGGGISRDMKLKELLEVLESAHIRFRLESGRKLIVLPN